MLADAGHMLTDVGALGLTLRTAWVARRPASLTKAWCSVDVLLEAVPVHIALADVEARMRRVPAVLDGLRAAVAELGIGHDTIQLEACAGCLEPDPVATHAPAGHAGHRH